MTQFCLWFLFIRLFERKRKEKWDLCARNLLPDAFIRAQPTNWKKSLMYPVRKLTAKDYSFDSKQVLEISSDFFFLWIKPTALNESITRYPLEDKHILKLYPVSKNQIMLIKEDFTFLLSFSFSKSFSVKIWKLSIFD